MCVVLRNSGIIYNAYTAFFVFHYAIFFKFIYTFLRSLSITIFFSFCILHTKKNVIRARQ